MSNFIVIETGGKQYIVSSEKKIKVEKLNAKEGDNFTFDKVLLAVDGESVRIGTPYISGAKAEAKVLRQARDRKKIVFKYHSKTRFKKKKGHRQAFSEVEINKI
ncbi:MAG: 50S ribosomal protein L21 [Patescibacteria group bacterium]|nr:50S ribosomal protein L21 [Patescibacteria group bacterium]MDE2015817.1 50S ribosomal protein L21 [Patescibacteria group bacterium]MDE2227192.1 50S ribosomal protein L21 [Patescibacteria group bacterium]